MFRERYATSDADVFLSAELEVLGSDYQANGYTTLAQATDLGRVLRLTEDHLLLDIGSGCGWPGLFLATKHGCRVVGMDPVEEGTGVAARRASTDGLGDRHWSVRGSGDGLPFAPQSFDAVVHTDVTC